MSNSGVCRDKHSREPTVCRISHLSYTTVWDGTTEGEWVVFAPWGESMVVELWCAATPKCSTYFCIIVFYITRPTNEQPDNQPTNQVLATTSSWDRLSANVKREFAINRRICRVSCPTRSKFNSTPTDVQKLNYRDEKLDAFVIGKITGKLFIPVPSIINTSRCVCLDHPNYFISSRQ